MQYFVNNLHNFDNTTSSFDNAIEDFRCISQHIDSVLQDA